MSYIVLNNSYIRKGNCILIAISTKIILFLVLQDYENFLSYVCKAYKGTDAPKGCSQVFFDTIHMADANSVCDEESVVPNFWEQLRSTITSWVPQMTVAGAI